MIRQETLTSKQDDLNRCITSRESRLTELYHATVIFLNNARAQNQALNDTKYLDDGETSFLAANNISEGRFFDPSTLPSLQSTNFSQGLPSIKTRPPPSLRTSTGLLRGTEDAEQRVSKVVDLRDHGPIQELEKPKEHVPTAVLIPRDKSSPKHEDLHSTGTPTAEELPTRGGNAVESREQLKANDDLNGATKRQLSEGSQKIDISLPGSLPTTRELDKPLDTPRTPTIEHGFGSIRAIPLVSENTAAKPTAVAPTLNSTQPSSSPRILKSSSKEYQTKGLDDVSRQGYGPGKEQATESMGKQSTMADEIVKQPVDAEDSDVRDADHKTLDTNNDSNSISEDSKSVQSSTQQAPKNHFHNISGNDTGTAARHDTDRRLQLRIPRLESTFTGTPSTPDEQLRHEEAQSMQQFKVPSNITSDQTKAQDHSESVEAPASISSQFVHVGLDEEDEETSVHASIDDINLDQHDPSSKEFSEHNESPMKPMMGLRERTFPGMVGDFSKDLTLSRRPPMRIDTKVPPTSEFQKSAASKKTTTPSTTHFSTILTSETPNKLTPSSAPAQSPPERMTTRVSSGAIRHKTVSEILGETPKSANQSGDKSPYERSNNELHRDETSIQTPRSASAITSPDPAAFKQRLNELKGKERSKLSTVVFARQQPSNGSRYLDSSQSQRSDANEIHFKNKDYLQPLFAMQAATPPVSHPLHSLITLAHKTLSTSSHYINFHEQQDCRMLERIFQLQSSNRWSLRQLERSVEPDRPTTHWDVMLSQMKWMRTDFKEERKWKIAAAKSTADSCAEWVKSSAKGRLMLQIKTRPLPQTAEAKSVSVPTPELVPSTEDDSSVTTDYDSPHLELPHGSAPAAIFSLAPDMFYFGVDKTPVTEKLLLELPLYQPSADYEDAALHIKSIAPDAYWRTPLIPLSKFVQGKILSQSQGPARKKSRYNYQDEDHSTQELPNRLFLPSESFRDVMEPEQENVALFNPENKHIRDRIHAGHAFRPPSEHVMPSQSFFESRQSSQWTQAEDDDLRKLVREYAYNWSLISSCLSSPSTFSSGAERRTPWECFERWIGLEGLPAEMSKTQYFKAYHSRLQAAQKTHEAQQQALQQNQGNNAPHLPMRRRTTQPYLVDRRKNNKYLHLVDAMRKLAKKREAAVQKQQHVAGLAAMRKSNEVIQPRRAINTPQEFSRVKYDREVKLAESQKAYRASVYQQQQQVKATQAQKASQQPGQQMHGSNGMQPRGNPMPGSANGSSPSINSSLPNGQIQAGPVNQTRPIPPLPRQVNSSQSGGALSTNLQGIPHAPVQGHLPPLPQRYPPQMGSDNMRVDNMRVYHEANRLQAEQQQQRYLQQQQQRQQQHPQPNGQPGNSASPNMGHLNPLSQNSSGMLAGLQGRSGSPTINGVSAPTGSSSSPQMINPTQPQRLSSGVVPAVSHIQNTLKNRNPQASPEQISKMTTETLNEYRVNHPTAVAVSAAAAAMQAAAGPNMSAISSNTNHSILSPSLQQQQQQQAMLSSINPQQYAQLMRTHQSQQSRSSSSMNGARTASRSATPQTHRSGSAQGGAPPSQSPRPSHAQMAGGQ